MGLLESLLLRGLVLNTVRIDLLGSDVSDFKDWNDSTLGVRAEIIVGIEVLWIISRLLRSEREDDKIGPGGGKMLFIHLNLISDNDKIATDSASVIISENPIVSSSLDIVVWAEDDVFGPTYWITLALHNGVIGTEFS